MDYANEYPQETTPSIWYIDKVIREAHLQTRKPRTKKKGGSQYLLYPVECIKRLGYIHQSADFIGKKYIAGQSEPVNIFSTTYYAPFKLYQIWRILAEKTPYAISELIQLWQRYPLPDVFRMDNGLQFRGTASGKRAVGIFLKFLLNLDIIPLFGSPSKPWTNPHIEGHNRVFNEKVWRQNFFTSLEQIDRECERFNQESVDLFNFKYAQFVTRQNFRYFQPEQKVVTDKLLTSQGKKIYFIRFVESYNSKHQAQITILNEIVHLPEKYNHQFVFVEWNLEIELLSIYSEYKKHVTLIQQSKFKLNI